MCREGLINTRIKKLNLYFIVVDLLSVINHLSRKLFTMRLTEQRLPEIVRAKLSMKQLQFSDAITNPVRIERVKVLQERWQGSCCPSQVLVS